MNNWQRISLGLALAGLSAALFTLAFPPYDLWPLIFVGLVPMIVAQYRLLPRRLSGPAWEQLVGPALGRGQPPVLPPLPCAGARDLMAPRPRDGGQGERAHLLHGKARDANGGLNNEHLNDYEARQAFPPPDRPCPLAAVIALDDVGFRSTGE